MDDQVTVRSITGVDLTLTLAGPGTRSYAFVIDWHIRLLMAAAWLLVAVYALKLSPKVKSPDALLSVLPAMIIYFLYHPILEVGMHGRTPGKRMAGVRILARDGCPPSVTALLIRNIFRIIDALPVTYIVGLTACFLTSNRVRIGDMAAGTLLVLDDEVAQKALTRIAALSASSLLSLDALELVDQVLERWDSLEPASRARIAQNLLRRLGPADEDTVTRMGDSSLRASLMAHLQAKGSVTGV